MPPAAWGTETRIVELFGTHAADIRTERKQFVFRNLSAEHWIEVFRRYYGPVLRTFDALEPAGQEEFHAGLLDVLERYQPRRERHADRARRVSRGRRHAARSAA